MAQKKIPEERLIELHNRIYVFSPRSAEKRQIIAGFAALYGVSPNTVYRCLRARRRPKALHRADAGVPRRIGKVDMERYCQIIAAMKVRTLNKKNHHLSTAECICLLEEYGIHTPLQINHYAWKALVAAHQIGQKPVEVETLESMIAQDLNSLEAKLQRYGYGIKSLTDALDARPAEIRAFFRGRLTSGRSQEIQHEMLKPGIAG